MRFIGYIRVSRVGGREGESFIAPEVQREQIERWASAQGHVIVAWEVDLDEPGSRYERRGFQAALDAVDRQTVDGIVVADLSRFARSVPDAAVALRRLEEAGGTLISVRDSLDTSTPIGRFARTMMLAIAELELDRIRENWRSATEHAIERGVHVASVPPFGYRRAADGRLEPDPHDAPLLREVFLRRAAGTPWRELAEYLDEHAPRPEGGAWRRNSVAQLVRRETYLGVAHSGDLRNREAHLPLVSRSEWEAAQSLPNNLSQARVGKLLLVGLMVCASCGRRMTTTKTGKRRGYVCQKRSSSGVCPAPAAIGSRVDGYVEERFLALLPETRLYGLPIVDTGNTLAAVEAAEHEIQAYRDANVVDIIGPDLYREGLTVRARALEHARLQHAEAVHRAPGILTAELHEVWPGLTVPERNLVLHDYLDRVEVRRSESTRPPVSERVRIIWRPGVLRESAPQDGLEGTH